MGEQLTLSSSAYIAVKASLHASDCSVFGLSEEEVSALAKRFGNSCKPVINGVLLKAPPLQIVNALGLLGYRVISTCGEAETVWTLQREI